MTRDDQGLGVSGADQALKRLLAGNARFAAGRPEHPDQDPDRRQALLAGQDPFAIILGCSDSRIPPEVIFDQGLGNLFVIRVAGNIVDDAVIASIEYAVTHLNTPLTVVLGHSTCGAITAAASGADPEGHIASLARILQPAIAEARGMGGDLIERAARIHALRMVAQLRVSRPILADRVRARKVAIMAAHYDQASGRVEILGC